MVVARKETRRPNLYELIRRLEEMILVLVGAGRNTNNVMDCNREEYRVQVPIPDQFLLTSSMAFWILV